MARQLLTPDQARNAVYLDFEGFKDEPAALLGWLGGQLLQPTASDVMQTVLDKTYELPARHSGLPTRDLTSAIDQLVTDATRDGPEEWRRGVHPRQPRAGWARVPSRPEHLLLARRDLDTLGLLECRKHEEGQRRERPSQAPTREHPPAPSGAVGC